MVTATAVCALVLLTALGAAHAQQPPPTPTQPFAPAWGLLAGWDVFNGKGCGTCHALRGAGGGVGPDLGRIATGKSFFELGAAMWNHLPKMGARMRELRIERPTLTPRETADLIAFLFTAQYFDELGDAKAGEKLFASKGCVQCHAIGGKGPKVGPDLGRVGHHVSLTAFAARMWNHGPAMWAKMKERGIEPPKLAGQDMADILAYLYTSRYFDQRADARRGAQVVQAKGCTTCHSVRGRGGKLAADFATSNVVATPASLIAGMWNHSAYMEAKAQKQDVAWPTLSGQELADIATYLGSLARAGGAKSQPK